MPTSASTSPPPPEAALPIRETFGNRSVMGIAWLSLQTIGAKGVVLIGQIILAWLLSPEDFGLIGLAYTVSALVGTLNNFGIEQVLVHRHLRFDRWASSAFWMSLTMGMGAAAIMAVAAPFASRMYGEPRLTGLLLVLAIAAPLGNLVIVPKAKVQTQLRFRFMAGSGFIQTVATMGLTVLFAVLGFDAYSFVLPMPIVAIGMAGWYWWSAPSPVHARLQWRRWKFLFGDSALLFIIGLLWTVTSQGDYFILGLFYSAEIVGIYYFAFNLSLQSVGLFMDNLRNVLFPILSKLNDDPPRQVAAFMRSTRVLTLVTVPACLLQAAVAAPVIDLLFGARWQDSIPVLRILSVAMALRVVGDTGGSLLTAQGRFKTRLWLVVFRTAIFFPLVFVGARWAGPVGAAWGILAYYALYTPVSLLVMLRPSNVRLWAMGQLFIPTLVIGGVSVGIAYVATFWLERYSWGSFPQIVLCCLIGLTLYVLMMRKADAQAWDELMTRFHPLLKLFRLRSVFG